MKVLLIGLGQLGAELVRVLKPAHSVFGVDYPETDITRMDSVNRFFDKHDADLVINAAAYTDVEGAESYRDVAYAVNETGAGNVARAAADRGMPIVYFSTDFVFDGKKGAPYLPDDATEPLSVYGASKLAGEVATIACNPAHFILRTAWLYGPGGNNFVEKVIGWAGANDSIRVVTDEVGSPTHTWDLAELTERLMGTQAYGIYHAVNGGVCSRFELAGAIVDGMGLSVELVECLSSKFVTKAERPANSVLDCSSVVSACGYEMRSWESSLTHYLERREDLLTKGQG